MSRNGPWKIASILKEKKDDNDDLLNLKKAMKHLNNGVPDFEKGKVVIDQKICFTPGLLCRARHMVPSYDKF